MAPPTTPEEVKCHIQDAIGMVPTPQGGLEHLHHVILHHPEKFQRDKYIDAQRQMRFYVEKLRYFLSHNNYGVLAENPKDRESRIRRACAAAWGQFRGLSDVLVGVSWQLFNNLRACEKKTDQEQLVGALIKAYDEAELLLVLVGRPEELEWGYC